MKFVCSKQDLLEAVTTVQKAVMTKSTLPILEGIYIEADDNLKLVGNSFDLGIESSIAADVMDKGAIVLNSKIFGDIIRKLPGGEVFIDAKDNYIVVIECGNSYFEIKGMAPGGFPMLPEIKEEKKVSITQTLLKDLIHKTIYAISADENRKILTGSLLEVENGEFNIVSLDGFRLAISKALIKEDVEFKAVIPGKNLNEIQKILETSEDEVKITISENQVLFEINGCRIISKLLSGEYMNYRNFIPDKFETEIEIETKELIESIDRASLISNDDKRYPVKFIIRDNNMIVTSSAEIGILKDEIQVDMDGVDLTIGFNPKYFLDSLKVIDEERIKISFSSSIGPSVIRPVNGDRFTFMVLPVRMNN